MAKHIFVTGGVVSGLGKGITASSIGLLLKARGLKVASQKFDPYINVDPGTMSPFQHGEVFVTEDGAETLIFDEVDAGIGGVTAVTPRTSWRAPEGRADELRGKPGIRSGRPPLDLLG